MFDTPNPQPVSEHLPFNARMQLVRASQVPITSGDLLARVRAVNEASARVRSHYPEFFKKEEAS